ncbi:MAG: S-layer homology domain-containing protein [Candidatus Peribacteraceae bacterium]
MDIRLKKMFAGVSATAIMLSQVATAMAAYSDVPAGVWFEDAVNAFVDAGYLDSTQSRFRGGDLANRAEFVKLVVELNGGVINTAPATPSFDDVATGAWYYSYFEEAGLEGWVRGDGSCFGSHPCYARPAANINRAEAAAIIVRAFGLEASGSAPQFSDNPSGQWYTADIQAAADHCVLQGDDSTTRVRPSDNMNRAEMVVMLHRVDQGLTYGADCGSVSVSTPMVKNVVAIGSNKVEVQFNVSVDSATAEDASRYTITGVSELAITDVTMTSNDTVEITLGTSMDAGATYTLTVVDMSTTDGVEFSDSDSFSGYTAVVLGDGTLEVTLAAKNPVGDTVPKGAQGVVFTSLDLSAVADDVVVESLTVLHEGFGDSADFSGVYAMVDGARVTRKRTIDSSSYTATLRFTKPLRVTKGDTVTIQVAGDFTTSAVTASEHSLTVELPTDFVSNAKSVTGNFPLRGKSFRVAAVSAGTVSIEYRSATPSDVKVGDKGSTVGKFEVNVNNVEDQTIYSMTLENDGTASDGDFGNLAIERSDGTVLTKTVAATVSDFATFVFDPPFTVLEGDRITLTLVADINGGAAKNIKFHFDETGDIFAVGSLYGYGVNGQLYGSAITLPVETSTLPSTVTIDAGQFTISIDGPVTQQFTNKDKNAVLANVWFETGGEDVNVEEIYGLVEATSATGGSINATVESILSTVELRNTTTGRTITGVRLTASANLGTTNTGSFQVYRFDDFIVSGKQKYELRTDFVSNVAANGTRVRVHLCGEATYALVNGALVSNTSGCTLGGRFNAAVTTYNMIITGVSTNDRIGDYRPGGTLAGNFQEVKTAGLTITGKATATSDTSVENAKNVSLLRFEARASEASDVLLTDLIFEAATSTSLVNATNYTLWVDTNDDGTVDTIVETGVSAQSSKVTFDQFNEGGYVIPKQKSIVFELHGDIATSLSGTSPVLSLRFATGSTYVTAEQVNDGSALSGIGTRDINASTYESGSATSAIQVLPQYATQYTLRNQGDLYVTASSTPIRNRQLLGGTLADEILRLQFHAEYEDIDMTDLVFTASGANATAHATNVDRLELYLVGATSAFATATVGACGSDDVLANSMCVQMNNQEFVVPKGSNTNVIVRPRMRNDDQGAVTHNVVAYFLTPDTSSTATGAVRARGLLSSNDLTKNDADASPEGEVFVGVGTAGANAMVKSKYNEVVLSKVASITNADPNANGTAIPTGTQRAIGQFKFSTAAASNLKNGTNKWTLSGVIFNVNATNVLLGSGDQTADATSDFKLYNKADPTTKHTCRSNKVSSSGSVVVECGGILARSSVNTEVDPGSDATFVLEAEVVNAKISSSSTSTLQVSLQGITDNPFASAFSNGNSHITWLDKDNATVTAVNVFKWLEYPETSINGTSYQS